MDGAFFVCLGGDLCLEFFNSNTLLNSDRDDFKRSIEGLKCHVLLVADEIEELLKNKRMLEIFRLEGESKRLTNSILVSTRSSISHSSFRLTVAARCIKWSMIRMWKDEFRKFAYGVEAVADAFIRAANSLSAVADDPQTAADGTEAAAYGLATTSKSLGAVADDLKAAADGLNEATYGLYKEADNLKEAAYGLETAANAFESGIRDLQNRVIRFLIMDKVRKLSDEEARRDTFKSSRQLLKIKQGLPGFLNGSSISALADTGSRKNIISQSYAKSLNLQITKSPCDFQLGSSHRARSIGKVSLEWAFAEDPTKLVTIVCHVLPNCIYDLILGNDFLTATQTLSRHRHRMTRCSFSASDNFTQFCFLGETGQRLQGTLADAHDVFAVPDTGAERNVMDMDYALEKGLKIKRNDEKKYLGFADGTCQETEGRVDTHWTFASGKRIPITFDVLRNCSSDVVIGEEIILEHNIFEDHTSSIIATPYESDFHQLAPFDFIRAWQRPFEKLSGILGRKRRPSDIQGTSDESADHQSPPTCGGISTEEQRRRDMWNYRYNFGATATTVERELERQRREHYASRSTEASNHQQGINEPGQHRGTGSSDRRHLPVIPSIATAPSRR